MSRLGRCLVVKSLARFARVKKGILILLNLGDDRPVLVLQLSHASVRVEIRYP